MEVVTFEDNLVHYKARLCEVRDYLNEISAQLNASLDVIGSAWQGQSGQACAEKIEDLKPELDKIRSAVDAVDTKVREIELQKLSQII